MATATLSNSLATSNVTTTAHPDPEPFENGLPGCHGNPPAVRSRKDFMRPQISVEQADPVGNSDDVIRIGAAKVIARLSPNSRRHAQLQQQQQAEQQQAGVGSGRHATELTRLQVRKGVIRSHTHACTHIHTHACTCTCTHTHTYTCMHTHTYTCMHMHMHAHIQIT